ncbi:hypothetical protein CHS0354_004297 [Potamilus streckersoni]|uniref:Homeobox domain-containing protein n=1 Tax=Potamilus streckersoni TaxID=2493646 RepID=A0AAE0S4M3_9BIVA|nr:hypothetical protein CHS0354_004297 [Potamilus streckersoni]
MDLPSYFIGEQSGGKNMDNTSVRPYQGHFQSLVSADPVCSQGQQAQTCPPSVASMDVSMMNSYCNYSMFSSITPSVLPAHTQGQQALPSANPFMGQLSSSSLVRNSHPSCAPNILHQGMDLASFTSPPSTHQDNYGMYSPVTPVSPPYSPPSFSPGYLSKQDSFISSHPELQASSSSQQNSYLDKQRNNDSDLPSYSDIPRLKTRKVLSIDTANILSTWYERHLQYPYPTDEEVKELSELTGVTEKQVKKWMANKRIRCFNTMSITGNKHPIKFKYEGRGKKRKHSEVEKDDSSSFEPNSKSLTEEARRILNNWFDSHRDNPYPLEEEKKELALQCGITLAQVKSWFANKRSRTNKTRKQVPNYLIKKFPQYVPMVEGIGQQREQARLAKKCKLRDSTNTVSFMGN